MHADYAEKFWYRLLRVVSARGGIAAIQENPAIAFTRAAKKGEFDDWDDERYHIALDDTEEEAALYLGKRRENATALFLRALRSTPLQMEEIAGIVSILADASARINYSTLALPEYVGCDPSGGIADYTPRELYDYLDARVFGQDDAKRAAAMLIYNHSHGRRRVALFAGPTGCGKSEIWRTLSKIVPAVHIFDASMLSADGWRGSLHVRGIFESVAKEEREKMIIVLDEADKMLEPAVGGSGQDYSLLVQNNLLKIMDGDVLAFDGDDKREGFSVDCSGVSVVLLGAFESLLRHKSRDAGAGLGFGSSTVGRRDCNYGNTTITPDDLTKYGNVRREITGRIHSITLLQPMQEADFLAMLKPEFGLLDRLSHQYGMPIKLEENLAYTLCREAAESSLGVRYIIARLQERIDAILFNSPDAKEIILDAVPAADKAPEDAADMA